MKTTSDEHIARVRNWQKRNPDKVKKYQSTYYHKHKDKKKRRRDSSAKYLDYTQEELNELQTLFPASHIELFKLYNDDLLTYTEVQEKIEQTGQSISYWKLQLILRELKKKMKEIMQRNDS